MSSDVKKSFELMLASLSSVGDLNAGIVHELNNPLSVISGQIELMRLLQDAGKLSEEEINNKLSKLTLTLEKITQYISKMNKLPRSTSQKNDVPFAFTELVTKIHFFALYPCSKSKIALSFSDDLLPTTMIKGVWEEIFAAMQFSMYQIINNQKDFAEKFLFISAKAGDSRVILEFKYPSMEFSDPLVKEFLTLATNRYNGKFEFSNQSLVLSFPEA